MRYLLFFAAFALSAATYEVGPGKRYADPLDLPWNQFRDGDTLRIHYRPEPYRRFIFIGWSNFTVDCVRSADGKRPVFDADGAVGTKKVAFLNWDRGLFRVGESENPPARLLENVTIRGCEIRNVWRDKSPQTGQLNKGFTSTDNNGYQPFQPWPDNGSGIQATGVKNIIIEDNYIHDSKIGISIFGVYPGRPSSNCIIRNNEFASLGRDDSQSHVTYTECLGESIYGNRSTQPVGWSSVFKSRGLCTNIYANYIVGGDRIADLVDSKALHTLFDDSCPDIVANNFATRFNANDNNTWIVWGGDSGNPVGYRKSKLYVLNNTFFSQRTVGNHAVEARGPKGSVLMLNNVIQWASMGDYGFWTLLAKQVGTVEPVKLSWGSNWIQGGSCPDPNRKWYYCGGMIGDNVQVTDLGGNVVPRSTTGPGQPPSAEPGWDANYVPVPGSQLIDKGVTPNIPGVDWTFGGTRQVVGGRIDIGAFEYGSALRPGGKVDPAVAPVSRVPAAIPAPAPASVPVAAPPPTPVAVAASPARSVSSQSLEELTARLAQARAASAAIAAEKTARMAEYDARQRAADKAVDDLLTAINERLKQIRSGSGGR